MLYLATGTEPEVMAAMEAGEIGLLLTPNSRRRIAHKNHFVWAADNACYNPKNWTSEKWWKWLVSERHNATTCLFATAPDVVCNADETMALAAIWLPRIRDLGFRAALVAQDGIENHAIPWDSFDCLFIGGSTEWKLGSDAFQLSHAARRRGKDVHMGRVNSARRWQIASTFGCTSADGTFIIFAPKINFQRMRQWSLKQMSLFDGDPSRHLCFETVGL
jgi:hypothetical protein